MSAPQNITWFEPLIDAADTAAVTRTVASGFVNEGPENRAFEKELCAYFGVPFALSTPSCTMALALSLQALGIGHGDTVLVPDVTFIGTASAVRLTGADVILVDVDPNTFVMDPAHAEKRIRANTKAMVPVHLVGRSADLHALRAIAKAKGIHLIEDAAEAMGSRNADGFLGAQSEAGCFSLAPTKTITSGQGGFVLTRSEAVRDGIIRLKDHGRLSRASDVHPVTGFNFKVTDMQAALARSQFKKLDARIARAQEIDARYVRGLSDIRELVFTARPKEGFLMWPDFKCKRRDELVAHLKSRGVTCRPYWPAIHTQPAYADSSAFPGAEEAVREACWLPCSPAITDAQIDFVVAETRKFFGSPA